MDDPAIGSRWIHKGCKRVAEVFAVQAGTYVTYAYEISATKNTAFRTRMRPQQTITMSDWHRLFTKPAPQRTR